MKDTIVVNLFAGPGVGKSTMCSYLFSQLKKKSIDVEMITEFAKEKVWENNFGALDCQFFISGNQIYRTAICYGKVDVIITDSPICLGAQYNKDNPYLDKAILYEFNKYNKNAINYVIERTYPYDPNGRYQTKEEAIEIDMNLRKWLDHNNIPYELVKGDEEGNAKILNDIIKKYEERF